MLGEPSPEQKEHIDDLLEGIADKLEGIRYMVNGE